MPDGTNPVGPSGISGALDFAELDAERMRERAAAIAGCHDFGDPGFEPGLAVLVESAKRDADLSLLGRLAIRESIENALQNRLLLVQRRARHPEVFETPLRAPLIVIGLPRSGTTRLHRLLAHGPSARSLKYWEVRRPIATPGRDDRHAWAERQQRDFNKRARNFELKHFTGPDEPEECAFLLDATLVSPTFWVTAPVYGYLDWYTAADQRPPYRVYREYLQHFQHQTPNAQLTLKAPAHTAHVAELLEAVPEARLVQLHRDPREVVSSTNSLFSSLHGVVSRQVDRLRLGRTTLDMLSQRTERLLDARRGIPPERICDVYHSEFSQDPMATVRKIYEYFGQTWDAAFEGRLADVVRENPRDKYGIHHHEASDFGLTDAAIVERFTRYLAAFPDARNGALD
jgi:hypothetical protein